MKLDVSTIRRDFPYLAHLNSPIYLDSAATTQKPQAVIDALTAFYSSCTANVGRATYDQAEKTTQLYEDARKRVSQFIGALPEEIIFTSGTTGSINLVANSWGQDHIAPGDTIVSSEMEHFSNLIPWQKLAKRQGAKIQYIPVLTDGSLDLNTFEKLIENKTKLVAITHTSNVTGITNDIQTIINKAHAVGAKVLIDAAQSAPHQKIDVHRLECDFLVFSGHKMLGPTGIGALYSKNEKQQPDLDAYRLPFHKLEVGTPPIAQAVGLAAAVDYLEQHVDYDALKQHEAQLCTMLIDGLASIPEIKIIGPVNQLKQEGHLVSFVVDGIHAHDVAAYLNQRGICVRAGQLCAAPLVQKLGHTAVVRASFYLYNTQEEVQQVIDALKTIKASLNLGKQAPVLLR